MTLFRGFIALGITTTQKIIEFETDIKKSGADVKLVEPHNIHITLKFLGDAEEQHIDQIEHCIKESAIGIKPFSITLKGTGVFPNPSYLKVVWIGIQDGGIIGSIATALDDKLSKLGYEKEKRRFSPHLTIGRVRTACNKQQLLQAVDKYRDVEFNIEQVRSIHLKKSELTPQGPIYTTLREIML